MSSQKSILTPKVLMDILENNKGIEKYSFKEKKVIKLEKYSKSQLEMNISIAIQFFTGLRINEIVKLKRESLEKISKKQSFRVKLSKKKKVEYRTIEIKVEKDRVAKKLLALLIRNIKEWLKLGQDFLVIAKDMNSKPKTIKKPNGKEYITYYYPYIQNFTNKVNRVLKEFVANNDDILPNHIPKLTTHGFRNNFIVSLYVKTGNDLSLTRKVIGHSDIKMTDRYINKYLANKPISIF